MEAHTAANFKRNYERHLQHLKLKGLQPKTIDAQLVRLWPISADCTRRRRCGPISAAAGPKLSPTYSLV